MNKHKARSLAQERVINVLYGDIQIGGIANFLTQKGYSEEDILSVDREYRIYIEQLEKRMSIHPSTSL